MYKEWDEFFAAHAEQAAKGVTVEPPMLVLNCREFSMAQRLQKNYPQFARQYLSQDAETLEFADGQGAVIFRPTVPENILKFIMSIGSGNYGPGKLAICSGIAAPLPVADRQAFRQAIGLAQIMAFGDASQAGKETFIWW